jgi:hypothetical protein
MKVVLFPNYPRGAPEICRTSVRLAVVAAEIRNRHLQNIKSTSVLLHQPNMFVIVCFQDNGPLNTKAKKDKVSLHIRKSSNFYHRSILLCIAK